MGIDGAGSPTVEQTGTIAECVNGGPQYYAWLELVPYPIERLPASYFVAPGDSMSAAVFNKGGGNFQTQLKNNTRGWQYNRDMYSANARGASAEIITERITVNGSFYPVPNFGEMSYTSATINGTAIGNQAVAPSNAHNAFNQEVVAVGQVHGTYANVFNTGYRRAQ